jgi:hypothetical protein
VADITVQPDFTMIVPSRVPEEVGYSSDLELLTAKWAGPLTPPEYLWT